MAREIYQASAESLANEPSARSWSCSALPSQLPSLQDGGQRGHEACAFSVKTAATSASFASACDARARRGYGRQTPTASWENPSLRLGARRTDAPATRLPRAVPWCRTRQQLWYRRSVDSVLPSCSADPVWLEVHGSSSPQQHKLAGCCLGSASQPCLVNAVGTTPPAGWKRVRPSPASAPSPAVLQEATQCAEASYPSKPRQPTRGFDSNQCAHAASPECTFVDAPTIELPVNAGNEKTGGEDALMETKSDAVPANRDSQFLRETRARLHRRRVDCDKALSKEHPARVAIVGAGPVGLWVAVLLAREHARLFLTTAGFRISRPPSAPIIDIFERRTDDSGYGSRRIILAMSDASQTLLNGHMTSGRELFAKHNFAPACSINLVESTLRVEFEKYAAAGFGSLRLGEPVAAPEQLLEDHDVVFVATGRNSPDDGWRSQRGMHVRVGRTETALIMKFTLEPSADLARTLSDVHAALARLEAKGQPTFFLRPGGTEEEGYVWLLGLPAETHNRIRAALEQNGQTAYTSFRQMWSELTSGAAQSKKKADASTKAAFVLMDKQLKPVRVTARISETSFWHSDEIVQRVEKPDGTIGWIVLVGDAACGKPFYLGSTLNGHFHDLTSLVSAPWMRWTSAMNEAAAHHGGYKRHEAVPEGAVPFKRYVEFYRKRVDTMGFRNS